MLRSLAILLLLLPGAFVAGRWSSAEDDPPVDEAASVRARHYRILWADSALDLSHGGGRWVHEVYLPDHEVWATIDFEHEYGSSERPGTIVRPRLHVGRASGPRNGLIGFPREGEPLESPITEIAVPARLAKAILAYAELTDRHRTEGSRMGLEVATALGLEELGTDR